MEALFNSISSMSLESARLAVNMVWLGLALTATVWLLWRFARPGEAGVRYAAWWSVLVVVMLLPLVVTSSAGRFIRDGFGLERPVATLHESHQPSEMQAKQASAGQTTRRSLTTASPKSRQSEAKALAVIHQANAEPLRTKQSSHPVAVPAIGSVLLGLLPMTFLAIWLSVTGALVLRLFRAHRRMAQIKAASRPLDLSKRFGISIPFEKARGSRPVPIRCSSDIDMPVAAGLGRPVILIPDYLVEELSEQELEAVIRHELAHIRRWDDWTKLFQKLVEAVAFFHPAVHWICRQLDLEREMACDEQVVRATGDPAAYARCLTRLAQLTTGSGTALMPGALTSHKQIFKRIGGLLNRSGSRSRYRRTRIAALLISVIAVLTLVIQVAPVIAVPDHAVTLDELSRTVRSIIPAPKVAPPSAPAPPATPETPPSAEPPDTVPDVPGIPTVIAAPELSSAPASEQPKDPEHPSNQPQPETPTEPAPSPEVTARVVDWNDNMFDMQISGVVHGKDGEPSTVLWTDDDGRTRVAMQGRVRFGTDNQSIRSVAKDGFVAIRQISDKDGSVCCELDIVRGSGRKVEYHYFSKGKPATFDNDARKWMKKVLRQAVPELRIWSRSIQSIGLVATPSLLAYDPADAAGYVYSVSDEDDAPQVVNIGGPIFAAAGSRKRDKGLVGRAVDWADEVIDGMSFGSNYVIQDDGRYRIAWADGRTRVRVELVGDIEFTDDDRTIKSISRRGYLSITEKHARIRRELEVEPNSDGSLDYSYYLNGKSHDFDDEAEDWLADILLEVVRRTGFGAEARVRRFYDAGGVTAVLDETRLMESDYVKRIYFDELVTIEELTNDDLSAIVTEVGRQLDSDYEKAEFLIGMADRFQDDPARLRQFVDAVATIDSDYETRRVLSAISLDDDADPEVVETVLGIADDMDSDYEKAELLIEMAPLVTNDSTLLEAYVTAVEGIDSDYETRRVLNELALDDDVDEQLILAVLRIAARMDSDYEKAELLIDMAPYSSKYAQARQAYVTAIRNTDSDYETRRIISALSNKRDLDRDAVTDLLDMADQMDSDYEKAELLIELSELCEDDPELQLTLIKAAAGLDSDYETRRVLSSQRLDCETQPELTVTMLEVVEELDSDYETAEILMELAECAAANEEFLRAFLGAAEKLDSDYERKRVLTELIDEADEPDSSMIVGILMLVEDMDSDFEKVEILSLLAPACRGNDELEEAYIDVVETMDSDFEIDRAYSRLYRRMGSARSRGD